MEPEGPSKKDMHEPLNDVSNNSLAQFPSWKHFVDVARMDRAFPMKKIGVEWAQKCNPENGFCHVSLFQWRKNGVS